MQDFVWKFSTERAPWWGGFWELIVRPFKDSLKKCSGTLFINYEKVATFLTEAEATLNSRSLILSLTHRMNQNS